MSTQTFKDAVKKFQTLAGVQFKNFDLVQTAFTHRSYLNERASARTHNERLEFLGDAVVELVVTAELYAKYPDEDEGVLTAYRAALVNAIMLGSVAESLGMNECLLLSKGESRDTGRARATILANTFEAVVGAIYLDQGLAVAEEFIKKFVMPRMEEVLESGAWRDAKSEYQEFAQALYGLTPRYQTLSADGPDHDKQFVVEVTVGDVPIAQGTGKSKQEAEQAAALAALKLPVEKKK